MAGPPSTIAHKREVSMCPVCLASAAWMAAAAVSTGGMTALVVRKVVTARAANRIPTNPQSEEETRG